MFWAQSIFAFPILYGTYIYVQYSNRFTVRILLHNSKVAFLHIRAILIA